MFIVSCNGKLKVKAVSKYTNKRVCLDRGVLHRSFSRVQKDKSEVHEEASKLQGVVFLTSLY